ncbi:hypothetical protein [Atlantibacter subterraneus]|uniref:hypothetical protein n=1 Tax=Atlantibacter subterraneus TaxID=255519 RepID=UPI00124D2B65|nr:hypothetical protein [Atlantibacter subterranea]QFH70978.1 hypothetical protein FR762_15180 [Enterobacter sp. E76]
MNTAEKIALFSMIGTCVSAVASLVTLYFARVALNAWKEQEVLKSKKDFKMSLLELKFVTLWQSSTIHPEHLRVGRNLLYDANEFKNSQLTEDEKNIYKGFAIEFEKFENAMQMCARHWLASEKLFKGTKVERLWGGICQAYNEYTQGMKNQAYFIEKLDELIKIDLYYVSPS